MLRSKNYDFQFADEETEIQVDEGARPRSHNCTPGGLYKQVKVQSCLRSSRSAKLPPMAHRLFLSLKVSSLPPSVSVFPAPSSICLSFFVSLCLPQSLSLSLCVCLWLIYFLITTIMRKAPFRPSWGGRQKEGSSGKRGRDNLPSCS